MCELTGDKMATATSEPREWWLVTGKKDKETEFFPSLDLAKSLAAINNFKYSSLGPYRVLHAVEVVDCVPEADEQDEREGRGERRAEEAERRAKAESEGTP